MQAPTKLGRPRKPLLISPPAVVDMDKVRQAVSKSRINPQRIAEAVKDRTKPEMPRPELHHGIPAEDAARRKVVPVLHKRQCCGFTHFYEGRNF